MKENKTSVAADAIKMSASMLKTPEERVAYVYGMKDAIIIVLESLNKGKDIGDVVKFINELSSDMFLESIPKQAREILKKHV